MPPLSRRRRPGSRFPASIQLRSRRSRSDEASRAAPRPVVLGPRREGRGPASAAPLARVPWNPMLGRTPTVCAHGQPSLARARTNLNRHVGTRERPGRAKLGASFPSVECPSIQSRNAEDVVDASCSVSTIVFNVANRCQNSFAVSSTGSSSGTSVSASMTYWST